MVVVPGESCPPVSGPALQRGIGEGASWLVRGQRDDGRFLYGYTTGRDEVSPDYNITRHAGVVDVLYRLGRIRAADAGLGTSAATSSITTAGPRSRPPART